VEISPVNLPELALDDAVQSDELASRQLPAQPAKGIKESGSAP
jgi:hypothetical protein